MCGIAGFISQTDQRTRERRSVLERMCRIITHRGPDEQGIAIEGRSAMGMRRLSIIDRAGGQQPIYNGNRTKLIVFNGEIYNYLELRKELESLGYRFRTNSDTESIIHAFDAFGSRCVEKLRGMFAFAIWDNVSKELFLARDRVGKKPLFYSLTPNGELVFGSEIKALLAHGEISREMDLGALDTYLTFGYVPEEMCIFKNIKKLPPGHFAVFRDGEVILQKFWDFDYKSNKFTDNEEEISKHLFDELEDAVRVRLMAEVPLGALLSGGVDSSVVVGLMTRILNRPVKTFSIGFNEDTFDELKFARIAANHFGTDHHEFIVTPHSVNAIEDLVWHFDEPFADSSALPIYLISKLARQHVTVALTGDGGDELFAGYTRYVIDRGRSGLERLPKSLKSGLLRPLSEALPHGAYGKNYLFNISLDSASRYIDSISHFNRQRKEKLFSKKLRGKMNGSFGRGESLYKQISENETLTDPVDNLLYLDSKTYLPSDILTKVDRMSMAWSLEMRSPLLDHHLIDFASRIPSRLKLNGQQTKYIFKRSVEGLVPAEILNRPKQGFGVPIGSWINQQLNDRIVGDLSGNSFLERGLFDRKYVELLIREHRQRRRDHSHSLWALWMLELWQRRFIDNPQP